MLIFGSQDAAASSVKTGVYLEALVRPIQVPLAS
jgi:hypothetical protein